MGRNGVCIKYDKVFGEMTLNEVKELEYRVCSLLPGINILLIQLKKGCVELVFYVSDPLTFEQKEQLMHDKFLTPLYWQWHHNLTNMLQHAVELFSLDFFVQFFNCVNDYLSTVGHFDCCIWVQPTS